MTDIYIDELSTLDLVTHINAHDLTVAEVVRAALPQIAAAVDAIVDRIQGGGRLIYLGAGTSGRLGVLDAVECVPTFGTSPNLVQALIAGGEGAFVQAVEGAEDDRDAGAASLRNLNLSAQDIVVGIAASGHTPYVLGAMDFASMTGALTVGISCREPAPLLDAVTHPIALPVGDEVLQGSTRMKAGTAQKMVLNMMSTAIFTKLGKVYQNLMVDVQVTNEKLFRRARDIVLQLTDLDEDAAEALLQNAHNNAKSAIVMHYRGVDYAEAQTILAEHGGFLHPILREKVAQ